MVRRKEERKVDVKKMFNGDGEVILTHILNGAEEMYGDGETYCIVSGHGTYNDNGTLVPVGPGDVTFVDDGEGHSIKNTGEEDLISVALILYK